MNRLLVLETIIQMQSFTKAAKVLGYTQSSVSQMVAGLEKEFGIQILKRSRNGVSLTAEGAEIYPLIIQTLRQYQALQERAAALTGLKTGTVRIGAITSVSCYWLPELFKSFKGMYPNIEFVLQQGDYGMILTWLKNGEIDFGLMTANYGEGFNKVILHTTEMKAFLPSGHPLTKLDQIPLRKLTSDPFILVEGGGYAEPIEAFQKSGLLPNVRYRIQDDYTIMSMVEAGLGISVLSELVASRTNFDVQVRSVEPKIERPVAIIYRDKATLPIASQHFIDFLIQHKKELL
ncbi:DNA-binding transcriptional regulator [Fructobacillus fructosus]|uniref:LysR family transcriptional regulator n=1 Tax=Fructobacillus fructosus TaxID=1631 RepID=UPI00021957C6|nr:LysR family transcriptional regulator [Fructobacillus fructosus]KRN52286.1 LysR family transcriptional regulator [Fructobacillus fructosus KCTC 3544]GAP01368.1 LysR substrate binding domain protein [Fructobacillus fructosus]CAK1246054.1 DNA-binding transcriptional regulator [Fructobacillus fructosus]